jgi:hypothetical protein
MTNLFNVSGLAAALIVLYQEMEDGKATNRALVLPDPLKAKKGWDVHWVIFDPLGLSEPLGKDIKIDWIDRHDVLKKEKDPLEKEVKGKKLLKGKVKGHVELGTYTYKVLLGDEIVADPDLEITF